MHTRLLKHIARQLSETVVIGNAALIIKLLVLPPIMAQNIKLDNFEHCVRI